MGEACGTCWGRGGACRGFVGNREERGHLEDLRVYAGIILKWVLKKSAGRTGTGFIWLRVGRTGELM
jgi:hypothetical protein